MSSVLVIGGNRGIGLALCKAFSARKDTVIATCRSSSGVLEATGVRVETDVDVTSDQSIQGLNKRLGDTTIDMLVCSAGIMERDDATHLDFDKLRRQFEVNSLGPLRVVTTLRDHLKKGSKVGIITSRMGSIADNTSGGAYGYRMSKSAVNSAGVSLAHDLASDGIAVALIHPGFVKTDMTGHQGHVDTDTAAQNIIARLDALDQDTSGTFFHANGETLPW